MSKSPSLRRIQADVRELSLDPSDRYHAAPLEDDMFEWHFTIRGAEGTDFEGGIYHGRILLPAEYPFKPPNIMFLTPSGRFETNTKICLSFSAYHPELWQPAWGIRLILEALISFLPTPADGAIGALDWKPEERKRLAKKSLSFCCPKCGMIKDLLPELKPGGCKYVPKFGKEIEKLLVDQKVHEKKKEEGGGGGGGGVVEATESTATDDSRAVATEEAKSEVSTVTTTAPATATPSPTTTEEKRQRDDQTTALPSPSSRTAASLVRNDPPPPPPPVVVVERSWWFTDPVVHGSIVTFAAIVFLLYRKVESLLDELKRLEDVTEG